MLNDVTNPRVEKDEAEASERELAIALERFRRKRIISRGVRVPRSSSNPGRPELGNA